MAQVKAKAKAKAKADTSSSLGFEAQLFQAADKYHRKFGCWFGI